MRLQNPDPRTDRLTDPAEQRPKRPARAPRRGGFAGPVLGFLAGLLLGAGGVAAYMGLVPIGPLREVMGVVGTAAAASQPAPAAAPAQPAADAPAPTPQPVRAEGAASPVIVRQEDFGDWHYACVAPAPGGTVNCSILQQLAETESRAVIFVWRIVPDGTGGLASIWQAPESVMLTRGLTLEAGTPQPLVIPFESCGSGRCQAVASLAPDFIATLLSAPAMSVSFTIAANRQTITLPLSPAGLPQALAALAGQ